ncbi:unnamed protein product [Effrenium voratum]|nr:unnamed protein product [Effrenium voratum]
MRQPRQTAPPVLAVRKRRLALPRERPMPTTPSSSTASSPKYWLDRPGDLGRVFGFLREIRTSGFVD